MYKSDSENELYCRYVWFAENVGASDFRMLLMTRQDREIHKMEERHYG